MDKKRAVIFVNGTIPDFDLAASILEEGDTIVAADGGLNHLRRLSIQPDLVVGDLDSVSAEERERLLQSGVELETAPVEKDETDLELALRLMIKRGYKRLVIAGALGDRIDHSMGNIYLLGMPGLENIDIALDDGLVEVFLIRQQKEITGKKGDLVSLLPIHGAVQGVETYGLYYPMKDETLQPFYTRGISNVMMGKSARVVIKAGVLLCIHTRKFGDMKGSSDEK